MVPRETGNNACAKFWRDKQRMLWYFFILAIFSALRKLSSAQYLVFAWVSVLKGNVANIRTKVSWR